MPKYVAKSNLNVGEKGKKHAQVKMGDTFECQEDYYKAHLEPAKLAEPVAEAEKAKKSEEPEVDSEPKAPKKKKH